MTYTDVYPQEALNEIDGVEVVDHRSDLPPPDNTGRRPLADNTLYLFADVVDDTHGLEMGYNTPLIGFWPSVSGYIYTGGGTAIQSSGVPHFVSRLFIAAPGGTVVNASGDATTEHYWHLTTVADPTGGALTNIASLGTIDGFRTPVFDSCNFESFDGGFTFTGTTEKVSVLKSVFRDVTASNVNIFTLAAGLDADIVRIGGTTRVVNIAADTNVAFVEQGGLPSNALKMGAMDIDVGVNDNNVVAGSADRFSVRVRINDVFPLANSKAIGELDFKDGAGYTVTGSGAGPTVIDPPTTLGTNEVMSQLSNGVLQYDGIANEKRRVFVAATATGVNSRVEVGITRNGTPIDTPPVAADTGNTSSEVPLSVAGTVLMETGDQFAATVENTEGSTDVDVTSFVVAI